MIEAPRLHVPSTAEKGEVVRIRTKIPHPMETGWRKDRDGKQVPQNRINRFVCTFNGTEVFSADMFSGVSADPYLSFFVRVEETGTVECIWEADEGKTFRKSATITVA